MSTVEHLSEERESNSKLFYSAQYGQDGRSRKMLRSQEADVILKIFNLILVPMTCVW